MTDLTKYRLEIADERLGLSKLAFDNSYFRNSVTNSYYAMFNAVRALFSEREIDFKKHSAVISYFRREYVKTGLLDYIGDAFTGRQHSDYKDFFVVSREEAEIQHQHAVEFVEAVKTFLGGDEPNGDKN